MIEHKSVRLPKPFIGHRCVGNKRNSAVILLDMRPPPQIVNPSVGKAPSARINPFWLSTDIRPRPQVPPLLVSKFSNFPFQRNRGQGDPSTANSPAIRPAAHPLPGIAGQTTAGRHLRRGRQAIPANPNRIRDACRSPPGWFNQEGQSKVRSSPSLRPYLLGFVCGCVPFIHSCVLRVRSSTVRKASCPAKGPESPLVVQEQSGRDDGQKTPASEGRQQALGT